jgi:secondary thiamine-phosphate synthase enzyme
LEQRAGPELAPCYSQRTLPIETAGCSAFHDLTDDVALFVEESAVRCGMTLVLCVHTSAGLVLNESETGLKQDFADAAERLVPRDQDYRHDDLSIRFENICPEDREFPNAHSHLRHMVFGAPSLVVPVADGRLVLGRWQRIFLVEFDRPRSRTVQLHCFGLSEPVREPRGETKWEHQADSITVSVDGARASHVP